MKKPITILAAVAAGFTVPVVSAAEDVSDQIIVTGARSPIAISDSGSPITVITRSDIERRQVRYVTDLLRAVPGFAVSHTGVVGSQTQVRVRGSEANHVLVLIDGVRANDPATGDEFRWEFLTTANVERIEVVRGPQSALWGSDAVGGVVHIITRNGSDGFEGDAYLESGTEDTINGALNMRFGGKNWSLGLGVEDLSTDGFNISRDGDEKDDSDITTVSLNGTLSPRDSAELSFSARAFDAYSQYDSVDYFVTGLPYDSDVATDTQQSFVQLGASFGSQDARVRHHLKAQYYDSESQSLVDGTKDFLTASDRAAWGYQADIRLGENRLSLGLEHEITGFEQQGEIVFDDPNQQQETTVTSVIADFQINSSDAVTWLLSARHDDNSDFDSATTARAAVAWDIAEDTTLRASVGTGQKTPTFIERFGYFPGSFVGNANLQPETSTSYDLGAERNFGRVTAQVSVFRQDLENEINSFFCPDPWPAPCTATNMDGSSERTGVEVGGRFSLSDSFSLNASYTYLDAEDPDSAAELRRPRHSGNVHFDYSFAEARGRVSLAADYGGTRADIFFPPWPNPSEIVSLRNYWVVDLAAQFQVNPSVNVFARASNLLDAEYEQVYGYRTAGRAVYGGVRVNFGQ